MVFPRALPANPGNQALSLNTLAARQQISDTTGHLPTILVIDNTDINHQLLRAMLKDEPCRILEAMHPSEAIPILEKEKIDLVVLDLMMPGISGPEFCRYLKKSRRTQLIPILMLTSVQGVENEVTGIASGADEFLIKPLHPAVARARVRTMLRNKAAIDSLEEVETILFALAQSIEHRDRYTAGHCERLAGLSLQLGAALELPSPQLLALYRGGYLHDIGKIAIPDAILFKKGILTEEEWRTMREHPVKGEAICRPMKSLAGVLPIIRSHHERWDGSGYPDGLRGEEIPICARILQTADIYDALTSTRPYKQAVSPDAALLTLQEEAARGWRDPELVSLFCELNGGSGKRGGGDFFLRAQLDKMSEAVAGPPRSSA